MLEPCAALDQAAREAALQHQSALTKPPGSLGELERIAIQFAGFQGTTKPKLEKILVRVFAADHGVCAQGVSAFPQEVTAQMIANFSSGGAAISVLSKYHQADFAVVNLGTVAPVPGAKMENPFFIAEQTADFTVNEAMTAAQVAQALNMGRQQVDAGKSLDLLIVGDMGIGNTSSASAIYATLLDLSAEQSCGRGTGVDDVGLQRKQAAVSAALKLHAQALHDPMDVLRCVGGFEIAAMTGAYLRAAQLGMPSLVDGFISTAAALLACEINEGVRDWMLFSHRSAEQAHALALQHLNAKPLLDLEMRLGEGSGAAVAIPLLKTALLLHNNMATFADAGVADGKS